jgi:hypothetical protein
MTGEEANALRPYDVITHTKAGYRAMVLVPSGWSEAMLVWLKPRDDGGYGSGVYKPMSLIHWVVGFDNWEIESRRE